MKELLEEHSSHAAKPVLHAFFGELMVGGFISLLSFLLAKTEALNGLSVRIFGEHEANYLNELLETLHVMLFLVFAVFIVQCLILLLAVRFYHREWKELERRREASFWALRAEFITPTGDSPLPHDFNFPHYLHLAAGETVASLVSIPPGI